MVRDPHLPADQPPLQLRELVQQLPGGRLAFTPAASKLVHDIYVHTKDGYRMHGTSVPLVR